MKKFKSIVEIFGGRSPRHKRAGVRKRPLPKRTDGRKNNGTHRKKVQKGDEAENG